MRRMRALLRVIATITLAGCERATVTDGTECSVWLPISWSAQDTDETIREIKAHNARREAWCNGVQPLPPYDPSR